MADETQDRTWSKRKRNGWWFKYWGGAAVIAISIVGGLYTAGAWFFDLERHSQAVEQYARIHARITEVDKSCQERVSKTEKDMRDDFRAALEKLEGGSLKEVKEGVAGVNKRIDALYVLLSQDAARGK